MGFPTLHRRKYFALRFAVKQFTQVIFVICSGPLHRRNEVENPTSTQVERSFRKWRSVSFTDAVVHCPDFGSKIEILSILGRAP
ncbi:hypothetical protein TNCV_4966231 [Trichonephila clavipes]|nr:hypothetical protein TNCV_4966231 [Trichonephila clavipes]